MEQLEILFEDEYFIAVNKPSGMLVHRGQGGVNDPENLMKLVKEQTGHYLYPIHRIDRPVSGIVIFCLSSEMVKKLQKLWNTDDVVKEYLALANGHFEGPGKFDFPLKNDNGKPQPALTKYWPEKTFETCTLLRVQIGSGKKHQIRRHFARTAHHLVGDTTHGKGRINFPFREKYDFHRIFLHAHKLNFLHPVTQEKIEITCPLTPELSSLLEKLEAGENND